MELKFSEMRIIDISDHIKESSPLVLMYIDELKRGIRELKAIIKETEKRLEIIGKATTLNMAKKEIKTAKNNIHAFWG